MRCCSFVIETNTNRKRGEQELLPELLSMILVCTGAIAMVAKKNKTLLYSMYNIASPCNHALQLI